MMGENKNFSNYIIPEHICVLRLIERNLDDKHTPREGKVFLSDTYYNANMRIHIYIYIYI